MKDIYTYIDDYNRVKELGDGEIYCVQFLPYLFRLKIFNWLISESSNTWTVRYHNENLKDTTNKFHKVNVRIEFDNKDYAVEWLKENTI